ncbi:MAG TPA: sugar phosphate isomerase/epimerase family protein [Caulifigura sp.]|nr:sugar phosphate isomerase/epimerase family protein [Caulifigura sp.]
MRLGISSHTFAWGIGVAGYPPPRSPIDAFDLVRKAAALRVPVLQIADNLPLHAMTPAARRDLKDLATECGVDLEVGTAGIDRDRLRTSLDIAGELGSPILRTLLDADGEKPSFDDCVSRLRNVIVEFERAGVCLAIENHDRFPARVLADLVAAVASPQIGICLDTANSLGCGEDVNTVLACLAPHVVNLHIKDVRISRLPHHKGFTVEGAPAGRGCLDIPALLQRLADRPASMTAIVELWLSPDRDLEETIRRENDWAAESVEFVRSAFTKT